MSSTLATMLHFSTDCKPWISEFVGISIACENVLTMSNTSDGTPTSTTPLAIYSVSYPPVYSCSYAHRRHMTAADSLRRPAIITPFFAQLLSDRFGRKITLAVGSCILIAGAFVNAFAQNLGTFIAGRVLIGAAGPFGKITGVALLHEIAHPRLRPIVGTSFYSNYYLGSISSAWFCYGCVTLSQVSDHHCRYYTLHYLLGILLINFRHLLMLSPVFL